MPRKHDGYVGKMSDVAAVPVEFDLNTDLDLRLVRYFTVVAEHLNFGRAAAALHVAQPALSRQIQRLERHLDVQLFTRTPQGSHLTEAGEAFLPQARALLHDARRATLTARAATAQNAITVGFVEDLVITPAVRELRRRHPGAEVHHRHLSCAEAGSALIEHRVDAVVARMPFPFPTEQMQITELYEEPRMLVVPATHRLAGRQSVTVEDFAHDDLVPCPVSGPGAWSEFWRLPPHRSGYPMPAQPMTVHTFEDKLELVADGRAVVILPAGDRRFTLRPGVAAVPITGLDPFQVVVLTRAQERNDLVADFRAAARSQLTGAS